MEPVELENVETPRSQLFLVRVWREELGEGNAEWRGKVQAALTSEQLYFRDWNGLVTALEKLLELSGQLAKAGARAICGRELVIRLFTGEALLASSEEAKMNVRLHLLCFVTAVLLGGFGSLFLFTMGMSLLAALFGETVRNWFILPMIILFLVSPILVVNLFARIPARCWRTGCSGRANLLSGSDSFVYVCETCGEVYATHFQIGGD